MQGQAIQLVTLVGSLRRDACTRAIANTLDELAPDDVEVDLLPALSELPHYSGDLSEVCVPASVRAMNNAISKADGVVIVTPEYHHSIPGSLKNALDWLGGIPQRALAGKPVAIQTASLGMFGGIRAQDHLRQILISLDAVVLNSPEVVIPYIRGKVDKHTAILRDEATRLRITAQLAALSNLVRRSNDGPVLPVPHSRGGLS